MAVFETAVIPNDDDLFMTLNRGDLYNEYTTLWIPSTACFRYMLKFLSMRVLGEAELRTNDYRVARHTWLVQADRPQRWPARPAIRGSRRCSTAPLPGYRMSS